MLRKILYILAACCSVSIVIAYVMAKFVIPGDAGLEFILAIPCLFAVLDCVVLLLIGTVFHGRFLRKQMTALAAILVFLLAGGATVLFLFTACGLAVYSTMR
jgi:hypothetical protein